MRDVEQAARVVGPIAAADATARTGVMRTANTGSAQNFALPTTSKEKGRNNSIGKRFIRIAAVGANCQWAFGFGSAPSITLNQVSVPGTGSAAAGATLFNGLAEHVLVPSEATHVGWISDAAAGYLEWYVSDQPVV